MRLCDVYASAVNDAAIDPLELGQRLVAVLESGRRVATYKLATLIALLDFGVEHAGMNSALGWRGTGAPEARAVRVHARRGDDYVDESGLELIQAVDLDDAAAKAVLAAEGVPA